MAYNAGAAGATSLIDRDSFFNGVFRSPRDLRIEGQYEGEIQCDGTLTIAESARVAGTVNAGNVTVSGLLEGQVSCDGRFEILSTGQVSARVTAGTIVIREGAFYEGEMRMHVEPEGLPARELTQIAPVRAVPSQNGREDADISSLSTSVEG